MHPVRWGRRVHQVYHVIWTLSRALPPQGPGGRLGSLRRVSCPGAKGRWMAQSVGMAGRPGRLALLFGCMRLARRRPPPLLRAPVGPRESCTLMVLLSGPGGSPPVPDPWWIGRAWRGTLVRGGFTPLGFWAAGVPHRAWRVGLLAGAGPLARLPRLQVWRMPLLGPARVPCGIIRCMRGLGLSAGAGCSTRPPALPGVAAAPGFLAMVAGPAG